MLRRTTLFLTATPASYKLYDPNLKTKGAKRAYRKTKNSDTTPQYDKGPVEWMPRPVKLSFQHIDDLRDWMMRETLDGKTEHFNKVRELQREWGQHPLKPVLGDVEPKLPKGLFKKNHIARRRFQIRWHKANHPLNWMWMPKPSSGALTPLHFDSPTKFAENWKAQRLVSSGSSSAGAIGGGSSLPWKA